MQGIVIIKEILRDNLFTDELPFLPFFFPISISWKQRISICCIALSLLPFCCILTLDRAVNQRFLWTGRTGVNKWKQSYNWSEIVCVMKWYMQTPAWESESVGVSVSFQEDPARSQVSAWGSGTKILWLSTPLRPRSRISA